MSDTTTQNGLTPLQRNLAYLGCLMLALSMAAFGLSLANIQGPVLASLNGMGSFSLVTALTSASLCLMTLIGGSLMDSIGAKKLVLWFGLINCICGIGLAFASSLSMYLILRVVLSACQGAFSAVPFIAVRQIFPVKEVPKYVGFLSGALAIGSFIGSWGAGWLMDHGMTGMASAFPTIFLAIGIYLIYRYLPNGATHKGVHLDWIGALLLGICLFALVFWLNYGAILGWGSAFVLTCAAITIISFILLLIAEKKISSPLIPLNLFKNKTFVIVLLITGLCVVYLTAINAYVPQAMQQLMGQPASISGTVQIPRTILSILVPGAAGVWIAKKLSNFWKAFAYCAILVIIPTGLLVFIGPNMPVWFVFVMLALTGIADSFRTVSSIPAAQMLLKPQDLGIGTSLVGFIISLSGVIASALFSIAYNALTQATPGNVGMTQGIDTVLLISCAAAVIALLLAIFVFRPMFPKAVAAMHKDDDASAK